MAVSNQVSAASCNHCSPGHSTPHALLGRTINTSRRCTGGLRSKPSVGPRPVIQAGSGAIRTTSLRDHTPARRWRDAARHRPYHELGPCYRAQIHHRRCFPGAAALWPRTEPARPARELSPGPDQRRLRERHGALARASRARVPEHEAAGAPSRRRAAVEADPIGPQAPRRRHAGARDAGRRTVAAERPTTRVFAGLAGC